MNTVWPAVITQKALAIIWNSILSSCLSNYYNSSFTNVHCFLLSIDDIEMDENKLPEGSPCLEGR